MTLTPKEIVKKLDEYVIGQTDAKKVIAIALRNRYRRMKLEKSMQDDVVPKNILMIGSTGVGKTEIARRLSKMMNLPFVKVEASKYTKVGFVGRDVESMVRDLAEASLHLVTKQYEIKNKDKIDNYIAKRILEKILPPLPKGASSEKVLDYEKSLDKTRQKFENGEFDNLIIEIEVLEDENLESSTFPPEVISMKESLIKIIGGSNKRVKKNLSVKDAKVALRHEAIQKNLDLESIKLEALRKAENEGIIFIDEIDKVAAPTKNMQDPSNEGVQRDLLPIVEGSVVNTKIGNLKTEHILFIAAGAFHISKPSDLIPELQGRFPLRVELNSLNENALFEILTKPKHSLVKQYIALLQTEGVKLEFKEDALRKISQITAKTNESVEDIGARRLHTVIEKVLEDISFDADEHSGETIEITEDLVCKKLDEIAQDEDLARYIL